MVSDKTNRRDVFFGRPIERRRRRKQKKKEYFALISSRTTKAWNISIAYSQFCPYGIFTQGVPKTANAKGPRKTDYTYVALPTESQKGAGGPKKNMIATATLTYK